MSKETFPAKDYIKAFKLILRVERILKKYSEIMIIMLIANTIIEELK